MSEQQVTGVASGTGSIRSAHEAPDGYSPSVTIPNADEWICCGCGKPWELGEYKTCHCPTNVGFVRGEALKHRSAKPRCAWCNSVPIRANLDGDDLCQACCDKWVRAEGFCNAPESSAAPRRHQFWGAGEAECPRDIKAGNGELHTIRCKVCGVDNPRDDRCLPQS